MPTKRDILALLPRSDLIEFVDAFGIEVPDKRKQGRRRVPRPQQEGQAPRNAGLPDRAPAPGAVRAAGAGDRTLAGLIERLTGSGGQAEQRALFSAEPEAPAPAEGKAERKKPATKEAKRNGGDLGFESTLWLAADKLRNNMDAAEYKHVLLGLVFLKYISDAFADLAARQLDHGDLAAELRERSQQPFRPPGSDVTRCYSVPTLERWLYRRRAGGVKGLRPQLRSDAGVARVLDDVTCARCGTASPRPASA